MKIIVEQSWLAEKITADNLIVVDCRFSLANKNEGRKLYNKDHIIGAHYFDLEEDLSGPVKKHGGRHPLPNLIWLKEKLESIGVTNESNVVVYDQGVGAFAARFWWLLSFMGHEKVYILNGGYNNWKKNGFPTTTEKPVKKRAIFNVKLNENMIADVGDVKKAINSIEKNSILIDSREEKRYLGIEEPIDKKSGRIPGAINKVWLNVLENGFFKDKEDYKKAFSNINYSNNVIIYCGSGITAMPNYIAMKIAGFKNIKVYIGSFSDWISYEDNQVEHG